MFLFQHTPASEPGSLSYLLGCVGQGLGIAVDVHQDEIDLYLDVAEKKGIKIAYVIDTHVHADHYSGGYELAQRSGGQYALHKDSPAQCDFMPLDDRQIVKAGNVEVDVMYTPGHTDDSIILMVTDRSRADEPWFLVTGHTLFVGSVGRPDLHGREEEMANKLYDSIHGRILPLSDTMEILPGAQAGSVCGAGISGKPMSTLGFEKRYNATLKLDREAFVKQVAGTVLPEPDAMKGIVAFNLNPSQKS
ncbi:MBL fold metallo-hydrolase [Thiomicrorhabdus sediminis]|uniref:MBL fold metallo-hydrolase n=1 Tax=Thiomicrorhabdus sediminis TaxID=2580412 RepID=A0A4V1HI20_9GAMM|nr:MBL fold metallo-hydrolase [Thiomicrorhabdus sediminis]QCU90993.1 MBL fold metallo-hydrolase [Thiomicrorhabdus sediminis]